jgi:hypothetical protein
VEGQLAEFSLLDLPLDFHWGRIAAAAGVVWLTYLLLISAWRTLLQGWEQHLPLPTAINIWCVSNLGRYLPGKLWSVAGLAVLAKRECSRWARGRPLPWRLCPSPARRRSSSWPSRWRRRRPWP